MITFVLKETVHPTILILPLFTHTYVTPNLEHNMRNSFQCNYNEWGLRLLKKECKNTIKSSPCDTLRYIPSLLGE